MMKIETPMVVIAWSCKYDDTIGKRNSPVELTAVYHPMCETEQAICAMVVIPTTVAASLSLALGCDIFYTLSISPFHRPNKKQKEISTF